MKIKIFTLYTLLIILANTPTYPMDTAVLTITHEQGPEISDEELHEIQNITSAGSAQEGTVGDYVVAVTRPSGRTDYFVNGTLAATHQGNTVKAVNNAMVSIVDGVAHIGQFPRAVVEKGGFVTIQDEGDPQKGMLISRENADGTLDLFICKYSEEAVTFSAENCEERTHLVKVHFDNQDEVENIEILNSDLAKLQADGSVHAGGINGSAIIHFPYFSLINRGKSVSEQELHTNMVTPPEE